MKEEGVATALQGEKAGDVAKSEEGVQQMRNMGVGERAVGGGVDSVPEQRSTPMKRKRDEEEVSLTRDGEGVEKDEVASDGNTFSSGGNDYKCSREEDGDGQRKASAAGRDESGEGAVDVGTRVDTRCYYVDGHEDQSVVNRRNEWFKTFTENQENISPT